MSLAHRLDNRQTPRQLIRQPEHLDPILPVEQAELLSDLAVQVVRDSAALGSLLHPVTRRSVTGLLRQMNSYYSNLIEGHYTRPLDIERALKAEYTADPAKRALQLEHRAHVTLQQEIEVRLQNEPDLDIGSRDFLCWIHARFYEQLPEELRIVTLGSGETLKVHGGGLRETDVEVGQHWAPAFDTLPAFLERYGKAYSPRRLGKLNRVIAAAASHHRLAWIHPFLDGNGRVARLFTHAYLIRAEVHAQGLWAVTRGFARQREKYLSALAGADQTHPDGNRLSDEGLFKFCEFFLKTAVDQIAFMASLLELDNLQIRVLAYAQRQVLMKKLKPGAGLLLRDVLLRGEIERGEAGRITGMSASAAREIVRQLLEEGLLVSDSPKGDVRLGLPVKAVGYFFPRLYPEGAEEE